MKTFQIPPLRGAQGGVGAVSKLHLRPNLSVGLLNLILEIFHIFLLLN